MIAKIFDLEESLTYDSMTDEILQEFLLNPQLIDLTKEPRLYHYHTNKAAHNPNK